MDEQVKRILAAMGVSPDDPQVQVVVLDAKALIDAGNSPQAAFAIIRLRMVSHWIDSKIGSVIEGMFEHKEDVDFVTIDDLASISGLASGVTASLARLTAMLGDITEDFDKAEAMTIAQFKDDYAECKKQAMSEDGVEQKATFGDDAIERMVVEAAERAKGN